MCTGKVNGGNIAGSTDCGTYACRLGWALYLEGLWDSEECGVQRAAAFIEIFNIGLINYFGFSRTEQIISIFHSDAHCDATAIATVRAAIKRREQEIAQAQYEQQEAIAVCS